MNKPQVMIAGGGIAGLTMALTLQQIGVSCAVFEAVQDLRPLGVGINLQPNAVRELFDLGITEQELNQVGLPALEWALVGRNGNEIYAEPRGLKAGYKWPQYAVHRGKLQMLLLQKVHERLGPDAVTLGRRVVGYEQTDDGVTAVIEGREGGIIRVTGDILLAADGLHSAVRAQMHPDQPPIQWGGAVLWRGVTQAKPLRTGSSFVGLGTHKHRMVIYPISDVDENGTALINWIAEQTFDNSAGWEGDWNKKVSADSFVHHFDGWDFDWLDVPALIKGAEEVFEYPMIDREPVPTWVDGRVALMGDAAHVMYPTGSNGASQAIIDARVLGAKILEQGTTVAALESYDQTLCKPVSELILRNRGAGPFGMLNIVDERCGGHFDDIDTVFPAEERATFMASYKQAAGFAIEALNNAPDTIPKGVRDASA